MSRKRNQRPIPMPRPNKHQVEVKVEDTEELTCEKCGSTTWVNAERIFRVSRLLLATSQDVYARVPAVACSSCGARYEEPDAAPLTTLQIAL